MIRAQLSPQAAPRACPKCKDPVGFALTYSKSTLIPLDGC